MRAPELFLYGQCMALPDGGNGGLEAQSFGIQGDGEGAAAGDVNFAVGAHDVDEFAELFGVAGDFDGEAFDAGIDHASAEDLGFLQNGGATLLRGANAHQDELPDDGGASGAVVGLQHVDELVHLLDDLGALEGIDVDDDGHAGELGVERASDGETFNVVAALGEQAGDTHQGTGLVFEQ